MEINDMSDGPVPKAYFSLAAAVIAYFERMPADAINGETFSVWMLLSLSYMNSKDNLLFRDRHQKQSDAYIEIEVPVSVAENFKSARRRKILERAFGFYRDVIVKRLVVIPATARNGGRTKSHLIYQKLVRWAEQDRYRSASVKRGYNLGDRLPDGRTEKALMARMENQSFSKGSGSAAIVEKLGPLWLVAADGVAPVAEEFSLNDCISCLPLLAIPKTESFNNAMIIDFAELLDSAGDRYGYLRRCGLDPDRWFDEPKPTTNQLRALAKLSLAIRNDPGFHPDSSLLEDLIAAHWGQTSVPAIGIDDFLQSTWGQEFIKMFPGTKKRIVEVPYFDDECNDLIKELAVLEEELGDEPEPARASTRKLREMIDEMIEKDWFSDAEALYLKLSVIEGLSDWDIMENEYIKAALDTLSSESEGEQDSRAIAYARRRSAYSNFKAIAQIKMREYIRTPKGER